MENSAADFLNRRNTEKVSLSYMDFYDGFLPEKVSQDTVAVWFLLFLYDWQVKFFFLRLGQFCTLLKSFQTSEDQDNLCFLLLLLRLKSLYHTKSKSIFLSFAAIVFFLVNFQVLKNPCFMFSVLSHDFSH